MVLDYYSKSKQTQSNTHCVLCVIKYVWWNFWSCMAMELFYDRRIPRDCSVMNIWCIKQVKWSGKRQTWKRIWNASKSWKCQYGCLEIGNNVQSFLYQHCLKNYTAVKTYIPGLRIRMFLYHRIKLSRLSLIIHSSWYNQKRMKAWMLMETLKTLTGKYFCTWVVYTYWEMLNVLLGQIVYFLDGNYDNICIDKVSFLAIMIFGMVDGG